MQPSWTPPCPLLKPLTMFQNFFKVALRNLRKRLSYSLINIFGLSLGLSSCLLIFLFVKQELSYDRFHDKSDRIFRVTRQATNSGQLSHYAPVNYTLADLIKENVAQAEQVTRFGFTRGWMSNVEGTKRFEERRIALAEPSFHQVFDVDFLSGNPESALEGPGKIVLTKSTAIRYFGDENPMGQQLVLDQKREFLVTGVVADWPTQSHFQFDFLVSLESTKTDWYGESMFRHWGNIWAYTYILAQPGTPADLLTGEVDRVAYEFGPPVLENFGATFPCQPLEDIYLHSDVTSELGANGSYTFIKVFIAVGVLILFIACFNFINLSTARASWRAKEVGMKKVLGINKSSLVGQFLGESILLTSLSALIAVVLVVIIIPSFNTFSGKIISYSMLFSGDLILGLLIVLVLVGFTAGSFPAFYLSSFKPLKVLKGNNNLGDTKFAGRLRRSLIVVQFSISITLVVASITIYNQLKYSRTMDLGMNEEQVVVVDFYNRGLREHIPVLKESFASLNGVKSVAATSDTPPRSLNSWWMKELNNPESSKELISIIAVDHDFVETMGMEMISGRDFSEDFATDAGGAIIINQQMEKYLGLQNAVGTGFDMSEGAREVKVIGVVKDFHFATTRQAIEPIMLYVWPTWHDHLLVRIPPGDYAQTIDLLRKEWDSVLPNWQFSYHFLDEDLDKAYKSDQRLGQLVITFAGLAIIIGVLGLLGLANYTAEQKMKEIGIRKVLGAPIRDMVWIQSNSFLLLGCIAFGLSIPLCIYFLNDWLAQFAYHIGLEWWMFALGGSFTLIISLGTSGFQSVKAALKNPVETLRSE